MIDKKPIICLLAIVMTTSAAEENTPLSKDDVSIQSWADGVHAISYGSDVAANWRTPAKALGPAVGDSYDIVCLGRGGQITISFSRGISNGDGYDFAVFENSPNDSFLELAFVEVSSDGTHFVRMFNYSLTVSPVGAYGTLSGSDIYGLASIYQQGYGTQFDLQVLKDIYDNPDDPYLPHSSFSDAFRDQLLSNYPHLDLNDIRYIRLLDIVGDGSARDSFGNVIYDPYPTIGSAGFDLDAIAVLHESSTVIEPPNTFINWSFGHGLGGNTSTDSDSDGISDLEEYFTGSNPTNATDQSTISGAIYSNRFELSFNRNPDAIGNILMETTSNLISTNWNITHPDLIISNGTTVIFSMPLSNDRSYYRLRYEEGRE